VTVTAPSSMIVIRGDSTGRLDRRSSNMGHPTQSPIREEPVDRARPVENAQNAFPTRSLENRTERGFPHAPQDVPSLVFDEKNKTAVRYPGQYLRRITRPAAVVASLR